MSVIYGLSDDGFIPKPLTVLRAEMNDAMRGAFGTSIDLGDTSLLGFIIGILAERLALIWELLDAINASQDPDKATGAALIAVAILTGTIMPSEQASVAILTLFGVPNTTVQSRSRIKTLSTGVEFATDEDAIIVLLDAWQTGTSYALGARVWSDTARVYQCITPGTSGISPVSGTGTDITDGGTVHWKMIQDNVPDHGAADVTSTATVTGPVTALAGDITDIVNGVDGLTAVTNLLDATPGRNDATNEELRQLREQELAGEGDTTPDALRAKLLKIPGITSVTIFTNETDFVNADGMPPHTVEALIRTTWSPGDPNDQRIYDLLRANVAAGITTTGNQVGSSIDSSNNVHVIKFSRPVEVDIYVDATLVKDPTAYPADGDTQIKAAIVKFGDAQLAGVNVVATRVTAQVFSVSGVLDVPRSGSLGGVLVGIAPSPTSDVTIAITTRQLAVYDTSRITLHTSDGSP
jgi:hypothetical protein